MVANGASPISEPDGHVWQSWHVGPWDRLEDKTTHPLPGSDKIAFALVGSMIW